jgi:CheY-like chemotaxis protein
MSEVIINQNNRILIVEDDPPSARLLSAILTANGYIQRVAPDGINALDALKEFQPNLILLDMHLPNLNGWEFLEQYLRQFSSPVPIIALSAGSPIATPLPGTVGYLQKPYQIPQLLTLISDTLRLA